MVNDERIANWGRNYLMSCSDINIMAVDAKIGNQPAKAALTIMSNSGLALTKKGFPTMSKERALKAVKNGIEPPYEIRYIVDSNVEWSNTVIKVTPAYLVYIRIDEKFNISYTTPRKLTDESEINNIQSVFK